MLYSENQRSWFPHALRLATPTNVCSASPAGTRATALNNYRLVIPFGARVSVRCVTLTRQNSAIGWPNSKTIMWAMARVVSCRNVRFCVTFSFIYENIIGLVTLGNTWGFPSRPIFNFFLSFSRKTLTCILDCHMKTSKSKVYSITRKIVSETSSLNDMNIHFRCRFQ